MDEFANSVSSLSWWLGVVVVGIVLNVVAAYLKPRLDKLFSTMSSSWRNRSEKRFSERKRLADELRNDKHQQILILGEETRARIRGIAAFILSLMFLVLQLTLQVYMSGDVFHDEIRVVVRWFSAACILLSLFLVSLATIVFASAEMLAMRLGEVQENSESKF